MPTCSWIRERRFCSSRAVQGFLSRLAGHRIEAILPQHGAILRGDEVPRFTTWLGQFPCGADYLYPIA